MMGGLDLVGKDASQMSDSDFAALSAMTNTTMRRPTEQERAEHPGAQIMAIPKDAQPDWEFQSL